LGGLGAILMVLTMGVIWLRQEIFSHRETGAEPRFVEIEEGLGTSEIAQLLKQKELIKSPHLFLLYAGLKKSILKAGLYYFSPDQSIAEMVAVLSKGGVSERKIVIIEGWRREQIAQYLSDRNIVGFDSFMQASENLEGQLFPDTYRISVNATAQEIVEKMINNYTKRTKDLDISRQDLIIASIVEREAKKEGDWKNITGVYINRLKAGMFLKADPTVQYGKDNLAGGGKDFDWWGKITAADYKDVKSDYNTYLYGGLPPGPICNPGLRALQAADDPEKHNYYYFFHLKDGTAVYSRTLTEHNNNKIKYQDRR
jgi:UPF0755 protein